MAKGLKAKARKREKDGNRKRPYTSAELVNLLRADPSDGRKWAYGAAIFDTLRLSLLTGARANEVCSLRRSDLTRDGWGMKVREEIAKTGRGVREVPLHPLARAVIMARLADLPPTSDPEAPMVTSVNVVEIGCI
jgi:integrase